MTITIPAWLLWGAGVVLAIVIVGLAILGGLAIAAGIFFSDLWK
jgi:hypothetical protein